jgi:hypothetical protein
MPRGDEAVQAGNRRPRLDAAVGRRRLSGLLLREKDEAGGDDQRPGPQSRSTDLHRAPQAFLLDTRRELYRIAQTVPSWNPAHETHLSTAGKGADAVAGTWKPAEKYKNYNVQEARLKTNVQAVYKEIGK